MTAFHHQQAVAFLGYLKKSEEFFRMWEFWSGGKDFAQDDQAQILELVRASIGGESLGTTNGEGPNNTE